MCKTSMVHGMVISHLKSSSVGAFSFTLSSLRWFQLDSEAVWTLREFLCCLVFEWGLRKVESSRLLVCL